MSARRLIHRGVARKRQLDYRPTVTYADPDATQTQGLGFGGPGGLGNGDNTPDTTRVVPPVQTTANVPNVPTTTPNTPQPAPQTTNTPAPAAPTTTNTPAPAPAPTTTTQQAPVVPTTTTPLTTAIQTTSPAIVTHTNSLTVSRSASSSAALSSQTSSPSGFTGTAGIVGGVAAGIAGLIAIVFAVTFFLRRKRRLEHEQDEFNAAQFRRSAVLMDDPPTHQDTVDRGFNMPPHMSQQSGHMSFGTQYGFSAPGAHTYNNLGHDDMNSPNGAGFGSHGESRWSELSPPPTAASAHPLYMSSPTGFSPAPLPSPVSPTVGPYDSVYNQTGLGREQPAANLARQPSGGALVSYPNVGPDVGVAITRDPSIRDANAIAPPSPGAQYASYPVLNNNTPRHSVPMPSSDYIEMDRSSVTPFQAAQYAAISHRLNAPVPKGLETPVVDEMISNRQGLSPNSNGVSPFADPQDAKRASAATTGEDAHDMIPEFPAPPPPAAGKRVDSTPPLLPEIHVQPRITSMSGESGDLPVTPSPLALGFDQKNNMALPNPHGVNHDSYMPSPMASSFIVPSSPGLMSSNGHNGPQSWPETPSADHSTFSPIKNSFDIGNQAHATPAPAQGSAGAANMKRPETVYDAEDAYGGM